MICAESRRALALGLLLFLAVPAAAQVSDTRPIKVKTPKPKKLEFKGEVLWMTRVAITVRSRENTNLVRTFTFGEKLAPKMAQRIDRDQAYQPGDRVVIQFVEGTDTALKLKGKPGQRHPDDVRGR